jgi:hypothetical protein
MEPPSSDFSKDEKQTAFKRMHGKEPSGKMEPKSTGGTI